MRISRSSGVGRSSLDQQAGGVRAAVDGGDDGHVIALTRRQPVGHPAADRVVATGEVPGVVGVQALDPLAGAADAAEGPGAVVVGREGRVALGGVAARGRRRARRDRPRPRPGCTPPAASSRPTASRSRRTDQPVAGGHRRAVVEQRGVADHHRGPVGGADHDLERALGGARPEQVGDRVAVGRARRPRPSRRAASTSSRTTTTTATTRRRRRTWRRCPRPRPGGRRPRPPHSRSCARHRCPPRARRRLRGPQAPPPARRRASAGVAAVVTSGVGGRGGAGQEVVLEAGRRTGRAACAAHVGDGAAAELGHLAGELQVGDDGDPGARRRRQPGWR